MTLDTGFATGSGANFFVDPVAVQQAGKILIGGWFAKYNDTSRSYTTRLDSEDAGFFATGAGANGWVNSVAVQSDGKVLIGGDFASRQSHSRRRARKRDALASTLVRRAKHMTDAKFPTGPFSTVCLAALFFIAFVIGVSAQEKRYALVIGNGANEHVTKLLNPTNDAKDMGDELKGVGFTVDLLVDRDLATMEEVDSLLPRRTPTEANIPSASFLQQKALALQAVLEAMQASSNKLNVVVLEACRDSPFSWSRSGTRGLTAVGAQSPGRAIVYSACEGEIHYV